MDGRMGLQNAFAERGGPVGKFDFGLLELAG